MNRLTITDTPLSGLRTVQRMALGDARGFLSRLFCAEELLQAGWCEPISQINHTLTQHRSTVRGMHFQRASHTEMKLVSCLRGTVWDVAVDLRTGSPTYLQWHAQQLSGTNLCSLLIPHGFAHGFQALEDNVEMLYCHSAPYVSVADAGLNPLDPRLAIAWPLPIEVLSAKDQNHPMIDQTFEGVRL